MKAEDVDKMNAGREMDALIAEKVMGWIWCLQGHGDISRPGKYDYTRFLAPPDFAERWRDVWGGKGDIPIEKSPRFTTDYSTDIAAAWRVLEELQRQDKLGDFSEACPVCDSTPWAWCGYSATEMALIICQSALKTTITVTCAACQKPVKPWKSVKEYEWRFCFDCHHKLANTDIQVRGRDRRGIFERAALKAHLAAQEPEGAGK